MSSGRAQEPGEASVSPGPQIGMHGGASSAASPPGASVQAGMQLSPVAGVPVAPSGAVPASPDDSGTGQSARQDSTQPSLSVSTAPSPGAQSGGGTNGSPWQFRPSAG